MVSEKKLLTNETALFCLNKHRQLYCPVNVYNNFLPSNRNEARSYSALKTERFRMMFIVWRSLKRSIYQSTFACNKFVARRSYDVNY